MSLLMKTSYGDRVSQLGYQSLRHDDAVTRNDVVNATFILLTICSVFAVFTVFVGVSISPQLASLLGMVGGGGILASTLALLFSPSLRKQSKWVGIILSVLQGMMLGGFSFVIGSYQVQGVDGWNLVAQAVMGTSALFFISLFVYSTGMIRMSGKFTKFLIFATSGFALLYAVNFIIALVTGTNLLMGNGPIPIIIGVAAIILGTLSLIQDFSMVDSMVEAGSEKSYQWMLATAIVSSLVWLYMEILRVLFLINRQ